jgi:hypothetical protein
VSPPITSRACIRPIRSGRCPTSVARLQVFGPNAKQLVPSDLSQMQAAGPRARFPGNPAWRSDQKIVLRPREYYRVTPAPTGCRIGCLCATVRSGMKEGRASLIRGTSRWRTGPRLSDVFILVERCHHARFGSPGDRGDPGLQN